MTHTTSQRAIHIVLRLAAATALLAVIPSGGAAADDDGHFSKMWLGKDLWQFGGGKYQGDAKDWRSMAGSVLALHYSGKGEFPSPVEFTLRLDRPLPMGEYRVFVKNFYRGKMEVTLGNVTKPATIRRYDWTPAVHFEIMTPADQTQTIVLRYFPTMHKDSGVKDGQNYIVQGVFITTDKHEMPFEDGRIIRLKPKTAFVAGPGNRLQGASFESGLGHGWGKGIGAFLILGPENFDSTTAAHGRYSLKVPLYRAGAVYHLPLESRFYGLNPQRKHSLSMWLKADREVKVSVGLLALPKDLSRSEGQGGLHKTCDIGSRWARYSVTGELNQEVPAYLYAVQFAAQEKSPATIWVDAVQLEEGDPTPYQAGGDVEVGWLCPVPGHIYYETEAARLILRFYNPRKVTRTTLQYAVEDYWATVVDRGARPIDLDGRENLDLSFDLYKARRGIFRATFRAGNGTESELVYSVLPPNPHLHECYPAGTLGVDTGAPAEGLRILKRANFNWIMSKTLARWYVVEPERGQYRFDDALVRDAQAERLLVMLQFLNPDWGTQAWLRPLLKVHRQAAWPEQQKQAYLRAWSDFVRATVAHYRPFAVNHFEIENEPNHGWLAEDYGLLLKTAHAAAKAANPQSAVIGFSGGGFPEKFYEQAMAAAGPDRFDIASVHFYHNNRDIHAAYAAYLRRVGRPGWNTETGPSCPTFYANLPSFESVSREGHRASALDFVRKTTSNNVNNYLMSLSIGGMEKYLYYFCRFANSSPSQPELRQGSTKDCVEYDGALRANAVALSIASHFLDGGKYVGSWTKDGMEAHVFQRGRQTSGFLWLNDGKSLIPSKGVLVLYDLMGNRLDAGQTHRPADDPIYFTLDGDLEMAKHRLGDLEVE